MTEAIGPEGRIWRDEHGVHVEAQYKPHLLDIPGVVCKNSRAKKDERVCRKTFVKRRVYLPEEYEQAVQTHLRGIDVVVLGMNGYSKLAPEECARYGVKHGAYEAACAHLLTRIIRSMSEVYPGIDVRVVHGASDMGVDRAIISAATHLNRPQLGFNCPKWMFYVPDTDNFPVHVAHSADEYAECFIEALDVLIAANGRLQAFGHDIMAAFQKMKYVIPVNVMRSISVKGGPPAMGADGKIEDAVAAFEARVFMVAQQLGFTRQDSWDALTQHVEDVMRHICRNMISPERAFPLR